MRLKRNMGLRSNIAVDGSHVVFEPGDATRYELMLISTQSAGLPANALVLLSPSRAAMLLPRGWDAGLNADYVAEKLSVNAHTATVICKALMKLNQGWS